YKGIDDEIEEYSAFYAKNSNDQILGEILQNEVVVCGIASEFCVRETILDLLNSGRKVKVFLKGIGYVDEDGHNKNLADLVEKRVDFI
ncbi:isochorismatase family protein, partial [Vibrio parahaemolyticus]|nr:isochorismatase family protein [Vibrio parahaemolyticus]